MTKVMIPPSIRHRKVLLPLLLSVVFATFSVCAMLVRAEEFNSEYVLGPADVIHVTVFQNPELTSDVRVSETGAITFPLIGSVSVVGLSIAQAQAVIAKKLSDGHFVSRPQVTILPTLVRGSQVTVVGYVNRPGRYPLETTNTHVSDAIAAAGGATSLGANSVVLIQNRDGRTVHKFIDMDELFIKGSQQDELLRGGETIYLPREPVFYVYGEVRTPGAFRLERNMTVMQGLAMGGGTTERGSQRRIKVYRQSDDGSVAEVDLNLTGRLQTNDVIYVLHSLL